MRLQNKFESSIVGVLALAFILAGLNGCARTGPAGAKGDTGAAGLNGSNGATGAAGATGAKGDTGNAGADGVSCNVTSVEASEAAPNGGSLISCPNSSTLVLNGSQGATGDAGSQGETGQTGATGNQGAAGSNGSDGTVVAAVQFCPNATNYPNTFSEVGFCINGSIWGVYSDHGGFLTEVVPGTYSSNGINSSCTFTVGANCQITR